MLSVMSEKPRARKNTAETKPELFPHDVDDRVSKVHYRIMSPKRDLTDAEVQKAISDKTLPRSDKAKQQTGGNYRLVVITIPTSWRKFDKQ